MATTTTDAMGIQRVERWSGAPEDGDEFRLRFKCAAGDRGYTDGWMDGIIPLLDTRHPRKTVVLELWVGDRRESTLESHWLLVMIHVGLRVVGK